jgi:hypothetical protein
VISLWEGKGGSAGLAQVGLGGAFLAPLLGCWRSLLAGFSVASGTEGTASSIWRSLCMSLRADRYRERAAEAEDRAAQARGPSLKSAFEEVAKGWLLLAEKVEWKGRRSSLRD